MSHSLYRFGTPEDLRTDWTAICICAAGINNIEVGPKIRRFFEICDKHNAVSMGSNITSDLLEGSREKFLNELDWNDPKIMAGQCCFDTEEDVTGMVKDMKEADLGLSLVVSGLVDEVDHICKCVGTKHHTVSNSAGIWGDTAKLPPPEVLAMTTMCGHGMISDNRIYEAVSRIKRGATTAEKIAHEIATDCVCGIFNEHRCARLLNAMVATEHDKEKEAE